MSLFRKRGGGASETINGMEDLRASIARHLTEMQESGPKFANVEETTNEMRDRIRDLQPGDKLVIRDDKTSPYRFPTEGQEVVVAEVGLLSGEHERASDFRILIRDKDDHPWQTSAYDSRFFRRVE